MKLRNLPASACYPDFTVLLSGRILRQLRSFCTSSPTPPYKRHSLLCATRARRTMLCYSVNKKKGHKHPASQRSCPDPSCRGSPCLPDLPELHSVPGAAAKSIRSKSAPLWARNSETLGRTETPKGTESSAVTCRRAMARCIHGERLLCLGHPDSYGHQSELVLD